MPNVLVNDLENLVNQGIITPEVADRIKSWYASREQSNPNRLMLIFSVLGSLLVSTGIILLVAHNWDMFSRSMKLFFAFLPLVIGQVAVGFAIIKKRESTAWRETSGSWLALSIGICIALISQIYHLPGSIPDFLLTWLLLGGPLIYLLSSSVVALLFIAGATWYGVEAGYQWSSLASPLEGWPYWLLMAVVIPHYIGLVRVQPKGFFAQLFHYAFPVSLLIGLGMFAGRNDGAGWLWMAFMGLLGIFLLLGLWLRQKEWGGWFNGYHLIGWLGSLGLLVTGTFRDFWQELGQPGKPGFNNGGWIIFTIALLIMFIALALWVKQQWVSNKAGFHAMAPAFLVFAVLFLLAKVSPGVSAFVANLYVLGIGIWLLVRGNKMQSFARLNAGLGIIAILAISRFFDTDLTFVLRGVIFIAVGLGFVLANYQLIQKKKSDA